MPSRLLDKKWRQGTIVAVANGTGIVRADNKQEFSFDTRGIGGKSLLRNITIGLRVEFQLYRARVSNKWVAVSIRHVLPKSARQARKLERQNLKAAKRARAAKEVSREEPSPAIPQGVERLAGPPRICETFLGPLEIIDDSRLDGLVQVRRQDTGATLLVSKNIVEPSPRPALDDNSNGATETVSEPQTNTEEKT